MRLPKRAGQCVLLLVAAVAGDAGALSRAMWAEFNAIYLMNLAPTAHCSTFRTRSLELLRNGALGPEELDAQMRALWKEARATCLQPLRSGRRGDAGPTAGPAPAPGVIATVEPTPTATPPAAPAVRPAPAEVGATVPGPARPTVASPPAAGPAAARDGMPQVRPPSAAPGTEATVGDAAAEAAAPAAMQRAQIAGAPRLSKPLIERPSVSELRLMAECEQRTIETGPTQTADDHCAAIGRGKNAVPDVGGDAAPRDATLSWRAWTAVLLGALAASGAAAWWALRRRRAGIAAATAPASDPVEADRAADRPVAGQPASVAQAPHDTAACPLAEGDPTGAQPVGKRQNPDDALEFALPS